MKSWKTTSAGILAILGSIAAIYFHEGPITQEVFMGAAAGIITGIGLIAAKDGNVTGGNIQQ